MANNGSKWFGLILVCLLFVALTACSAVNRTRIDTDRDIKVPKESQPVEVKPPMPLTTPDFIPMAGDITPLKTRIVNITARNTPLRDVLHAVAEASSLNLVMGKGVDPEIKVNLALKNVTAEYALDTIFSSVDYFYTVKENMLVIKAVDTRLFELGHPPLEQRFAIDVGGDILSGTTSGSSGVSTGGGASGSGSSSGIKGNVTQNFKADEAAFKFWDAIERSIANLLGIRDATGSPGAVQTTTIPQSFTTNRLTSTISVTATRHNMDKVEKYINNVRKVISRQVLVEAKIIEVQLSDGFQFGIDWSYIKGNLALTTERFTNVVPATGPVSQIAVTAGSFAPVLQALETQGDVRVLSNPRVSIMNGQTAILSVGRNTTFVSRVETSTIASTTPVQSFSIQTGSVLSGIMLGLVPYINEYGEISLTITPIISNLVELKSEKVGSSSSNQVTISLPTVDLRELSTTVKVWDGQTIIIGGLIDKQETLQDNQVPVLGNLPFLGLLFKSRNKQQIKRELVVLLQPAILSQ